jgi:hypothetical protein
VAASCCGGALLQEGPMWKGNWGRKLCGYIEATFQDISQEVKAWLKMGLLNGRW